MLYMALSKIISNFFLKRHFAQQILDQYNWFTNYWIDYIDLQLLIQTQSFHFVLSFLLYAGTFICI